MAEQEVIVEEAQLTDAKALVDLLEQVSSETDFVVAETLLSQEEMEIFWSDTLHLLMKFVW